MRVHEPGITFLIFGDVKRLKFANLPTGLCFQPNRIKCRFKFITPALYPDPMPLFISFDKLPYGMLIVADLPLAGHLFLTQDNNYSAGR